MALRAVVTGANRGIGLEVARGLLAAGFDTTVVVRTLGAGEQARFALGRPVEVVAGALDDLEQVRAVATALLQGPRVSVLVHNAGWWPAQRVLTRDGVEQAFAVNHLAPFLLTRLLEDHFTNPGRVVQVSAGLAALGRVDVTRTPTAADFSAVRTYATTKLCNLALTTRWAERLRRKGVTYNALHPGVLRTGLGDRPGAFGWLLRQLKRPQRAPEAGARNVLHLATDEALRDVTGAYFDETRRVDLPAAAASPALADALWAQAAALCGLAA